MRKLNWGILGLGQIATEFAEAFDVENAVLYAAGSRNDGENIRNWSCSINSSSDLGYNYCINVGICITIYYTS